MSQNDFFFRDADFFFFVFTVKSPFAVRRESLHTLLSKFQQKSIIFLFAFSD